MVFAAVGVYVTVCRLIQLQISPSLHGELKRILEELKRKTGLGTSLRVVWLPGESDVYSGEVREGVIYIYEEDRERAVETLLEEFLEYAIFKTSKPYVDLLNALIKAINEEAYRRRDRTAKALAKLLKPVLFKSKRKMQSNMR